VSPGAGLDAGENRKSSVRGEDRTPIYPSLRVKVPLQARPGHIHLNLINILPNAQ
jgi:hypothetical protein